MPLFSNGKKLIKTALTSVTLALLSQSLVAAPQHGLAMHGDLKYSPDFKHFEYANPNAPKGGEVKRWALGTFDSFNSFIVKGTPADGLALIYDSLMEKALDEPFSQYGLLAASADLAEDNTQITFKLRESAKFSDGEPVTAEDIVFTFNILLEKGSPFYRSYIGDIKEVVAEDSHTVTFKFKNGNNQELPLLVGEIPILPKHYWATRDFATPSVDIPIGSGPYVIDGFEPGRSVTYRRNPDYWAADLPVMKGRYNFDEIRYDFYRDSTVSMEAFKAGEYDFRQEYTSKLWATAYEGPQFDSGEIIKKNLEHGRPTGMQGFLFNTRRNLFSDPKVRRALAYSFDFEWTNENLFYGAYARTHSYFSNSEMAARELPTPKELALLEPYRDQLPAEVFTQVYSAPTFKDPKDLRRSTRTALKLLKEAGWQLKKGKLINNKTGEPFEFEILIVQKAFERIVAPMQKNLKRMGITATIRVVDVPQYINRLRDFDFDMVVGSFAQSASPGNEQREFFGSYNADQQGSRNLVGIKNPVVDALIEKIISAPSREELVISARALDRVLQWNYYVIPHYHSRADRVAFRSKLAYPDVRPQYGLGFDTWWVKDNAE
ncbi:extracellular solute-binding protein [Neptunomonas marina]|uniref:ABC transporter substrate-binding protein n=1 Tax=Neptunomonas marina TaxID=1815562 RepID=A0A437Q1A5_9GAMM|nr:extracellular solute-binding protein [Neptunomonas marina]RVU28292.1 ABC transporter substrate-binding protein [Neptunomonas marina]